ncbi:MAG: hypothetical protein EBR51_00275 [Gammaproteobacteria bacterium]|jgi:hypothetical protein|nr:hypothetical protein [Gammaproteobacteria bacterium]
MAAAEEDVLLAACGAALARAAAESPAHAASAASATPFAAAALADPAAYIAHLARRQRFSPPCAVLALHYLERVSAALPLSKHTIRRLTLVAHLLAAKFHDDRMYSNGHWAASEGISTAELNALEVLFLKALDWRAAVSDAAYFEMRTRVLAELTEIAELVELAQLAATVQDQGGEGAAGIPGRP